MTEDFKRAMRRLNGLRFAPSDGTSHWEALQHIPIDVLGRAIGRALTSQSDFPTPHELLVYCDVVRTVAGQPDEGDRIVPLVEPVEFHNPQLVKPIRVTAEWRYDCDTCEDSGMVSFWCGNGPQAKPWYQPRFCGRGKPHYDHEWVGQCVCVDTNPTIRRRKAAMVRYAQEQPKRGAA